MRHTCTSLALLAAALFDDEPARLGEHGLASLGGSPGGASEPGAAGDAGGSGAKGGTGGGGGASGAGGNATGDAWFSTIALVVDANNTYSGNSVHGGAAVTESCSLTVTGCGGAGAGASAVAA